MTQRDRPDEIEITPAMIEAGVGAACLFTPSEDSFDVMLPIIYRAMFAASPLGASGSRRRRRNRPAHASSGTTPNGLQS